MGRRRGFTLIELLVVMAILGILAGLLFPVFASAREMSRRVVCVSNLRQIAMAMLMYMQDNDGSYVQAMSADNLMRWHGGRSSQDEPFDPKRGPLWTYYRTKELKTCPSFAAEFGSQGFEEGTGGYGYNAQYVGGSPGDWQGGWMYVPAKEFMIRNPSKTVMLTDAAFLDQNKKLIEYSFCEAPYWEYWESKCDPSTHFRHRGYANVAFCDGHVRPMPMIMTHESGWWLSAEDYEKRKLGFLGEDNTLYDRE
jgi:prepilin-type N-terminal cleavage/methylation domain-containing protein/prepilin-type processing-associated H-X9-DG protein